MSSKFCIVDFTDDKSVEVVPDFWVHKNFCFWPPRDVIFPARCVKNRTVPISDKWPAFKARVLNTFGMQYLIYSSVYEDLYFNFMRKSSFYYYF